MQVGVDVTCMHANFGGCGFFGFGDIATLKNGQISLSGHGLYHGHQKDSCKYGLTMCACASLQLSLNVPLV